MRWHGAPVDTCRQHLKIVVIIECSIVTISKKVTIRTMAAVE
jgi:hypothetical protein